MFKFIGHIFLYAFLLIVWISKAQTTDEITNVFFIDSVWAANKVSFDLHTVNDQQFVAYYDRNRMMTVASRKLGSTAWNKKTLPNKLNWDSHNYVTIGFDEKGHIHVSGNMHVDPLVYFKSAKPYDVQSITEINKMTEKNEDRVTYPKFFNTANGALLYSYRRGGSGNGNVWVNNYNIKERKWDSFLPEGLFKGVVGESTRSAYHRLSKGPDGTFHCIWMWRWTPAVETSHQLCYAKSDDFINWTNANGDNIELPFAPENEKLIVDNVPSKGGLHNGRYNIIFLNDATPIIGYLKYDENGFTQLYLARNENKQWFSKKISDWNFRWEFIGGGDKMTKGASFDFEGLTKSGNIIINWSTENNESGNYIINPERFQHSKEKVLFQPKYASEIHTKLTDDPSLFVNLQKGKNYGDVKGHKYLLKWESRAKSHGRHAPKVIPKGPLSPLYMIEIVKTE